jgi:hypothetical protein
MPALVAIQRSPQIKAAYEALLARGKKKKVAIIVLMRRLLHAIWGMLHPHQDFNPQHFHASPFLPPNVYFTTCFPREYLTTPLRSFGF